MLANNDDLCILGLSTAHKKGDAKEKICKRNHSIVDCALPLEFDISAEKSVEGFILCSGLQHGMHGFYGRKCSWKLRKSKIIARQGKSSFKSTGNQYCCCACSYLCPCIIRSKCTTRCGKRSEQISSVHIRKLLFPSVILRKRFQILSAMRL